MKAPNFKRLAKAKNIHKRIGPNKTSYQVRCTANGLKISKSFDARNDSDAIRKGNLMLAEAMKPKPKNIDMRSVDLTSEILELKRSKSPATYKQTEIFFRVHINPFLELNCPMARDLDHSIWLKYKNEFRIKNSKGALFNHRKFFTSLFKYAFEKGILSRPIKLQFDESREDFKSIGHVIPGKALDAMLEVAGKDWGDRIIIQIDTGMRPGEVRNLRCNRVDLASGVISLRKEDTKTRQARSFNLTDRALKVLKSRNGGEFFFPSLGDKSKPVSESLKGWHQLIKISGVDSRYTPHDIRHSWLTLAFKSGANPALICYMAGVSLAEAQKTYLHFTAKDTAQVISTISRA